MKFEPNAEIGQNGAFWNWLITLSIFNHWHVFSYFTKVKFIISLESLNPRPLESLFILFCLLDSISKFQISLVRVYWVCWVYGVCLVCLVYFVISFFFSIPVVFIVIPATFIVIPATFIVIPATFIVIPAEAGIQMFPRFRTMTGFRVKSEF